MNELALAFLAKDLAFLALSAWASKASKELETVVAA